MSVINLKYRLHLSADETCTFTDFSSLHTSIRLYLIILLENCSVVEKASNSQLYRGLEILSEITAATKETIIHYT